MTDIDLIEEKIQRGLILYLREVHDIRAVQVELGLSEIEEAQYDGCETCGYGADEGRTYVPLRYKEREGCYWQEIEMDTTSINLLPTLLPYIDRAN